MLSQAIETGKEYQTGFSASIVPGRVRAVIRKITENGDGQSVVWRFRGETETRSVCGLTSELEGL